MELKLEKMQLKDIAKVAEINVTGWKIAYASFFDKNFLNSLTIKDKVEKLNKNYGKDNIVVAKIINDVVGFCRYTFKSELTQRLNVDGEIQTFYVQPNLTRNGIGTFIFNNIKKLFLANNKHTCALWCFQEAEQAKLFYTKMGGKVVITEERRIGSKRYTDLLFVFNFS